MEIVEVGPRDGLQNEKKILPAAVKIDLVRRVIAAGLRRIEVAAFARPDLVPQMADAAEVLRGVPRVEGVRYVALVLNGRGLERALALGDARPDEINYVVVASDEFSRRNQGVATMASLAAFREVASRARDAGFFVTLTVAAAFGCPFSGEVPVARVRAIVDEAGPIDELCLADTIGVGVPPQVTELAAAVRETTPFKAHAGGAISSAAGAGSFAPGGGSSTAGGGSSAVGAPEVRGGLPLRAHFHNTRNTGYANAMAAVAAGFTALDSSVGGIGGCPFAPAATGNIATEDLAYLLNRSGLRTGVSVPVAAEAGSWIGSELGIEVPAQIGRAGNFPPKAI
ncbi:hydroxymethylglutaryl-CoA lyase [Actinoplanes sp. L3-i22]|uniref:hydroxymethylglutaryl-CoA lyase n=1 Tax=Actinoplanes sp. L3-i22 TaxID=2836373 RepID=UPI001C7475DD|nr:hydroxymethylglutaryl-CoA lyase [Actinoplanes sp. L3-i22]BCY12899.1 hydroxymethylglutaryl-CoA lyase [Actinoplanes sp. L3-i22]